MRDKFTEEEVEEMTKCYDEAIRNLQKLQMKFDEPFDVVILPVLKSRRANLRKFLEG